jgi:hypothetical protein|tara:strand:- start:1166 stop:1768 length:603 start_codon:yes stop_codon:yes gene_type:complete
MRGLTITLSLVILYFVYTNYIRKTIYLEKVMARNGQTYRVRNLRDKGEAANRLGDLGDTLDSLCSSCKGYDNQRSDNEYDRVKAIERLIRKFDPKELTENIPGSQHVAYSVNKGDELSICLRDIETERFIDTNTVRFVAIHELSHIMSRSSGHTTEFWDNMKFLLEKAVTQGVYTPEDYQKRPVNYCGIEITSSPLDTKI